MNRYIRFKAYDILNKKILEYGEIMKFQMQEVFKGTSKQRQLIPMEGTGEVDKNGREIYEDYVYNIDGPYGKWNAVVKKNGSGFVFERIKNNICFSVSMLHEYSTLIGNIYLNPELME